MKKILIIALCLFAWAPLAVKAQATPSSLLLTELMPNPSGSDSDFEWIELSNFTSTEVELSSWQLNGNTLPVATLQPLEIVILARNPAAVRSEFAVHNRIFAANFSLANAGGTVTMTQGSTQNTFSYGQSEEGRSFELLLGECSTIIIHPDSHSIGFSNHLCGYSAPTPTPTASPTPSATATPTQAPGGSEYSHLLQISTVLAYPAQGAEWLEIHNLDSTAVNLAGWIISDAGNNREIIQNGQVAPGEKFKIYPAKVTLNNNGDTIILSDPSDRQVDIISYSKSDKGVPISLTPAEVEESNQCSAVPVANVTSLSPSASTMQFLIPLYYPAQPK